MAGIRNTNIDIDDEGGVVRERYYTTPVTETQSSGDNCPIVTGTRVAIKNNPIINISPKISINNSNPKQWYKGILILGLFLLAVFCIYMYMSGNSGDYEEKDSDESNVDIPDLPKMKAIDIENPETVIANKLIEVNDMINFANCLKLKNAKANVEQFSKDHKNNIEEIRIEVMDHWLKRAETRYWNELVEALKCVGNDRLAAQIENEFIK